MGKITREDRIVPSRVLSVYYDKICLKVASHRFLLYVVYMYQNHWILPMHSNVTIKNVSWPHFSWPTMYNQSSTDWRHTSATALVTKTRIITMAWRYRRHDHNLTWRSLIWHLINVNLEWLLERLGWWSEKNKLKSHLRDSCIRSVVWWVASWPFRWQHISLTRSQQRQQVQHVASCQRNILLAKWLSANWFVGVTFSYRCFKRTRWFQ